MSNTTAPAAPPAYLPLDDHERRELLRIARVCAKEWLRSGRLPPGAPHRAALKQPAACVVRLHLDGAEGAPPREAASSRDADAGSADDQPLYKAVAGLAIALAVREPPLTIEHLARARLEIEVHAPPDHGAPPDVFSE